MILTVASEKEYLDFPRNPPGFFTFYNGKDPYPTEKILRLSDAYIEEESRHSLELTVKVINIRPSCHHPLLERCPALREYSEFVEIVREGGNDPEKIKNAVYTCIDRGILKKYLEEHASEVWNMLIAEYDYETDMAVQKEENIEYGIKIDREEGKKEGADHLGRLIGLLLEENRIDDIKKASADAAYRGKLFKEFGIEN